MEHEQAIKERSEIDHAKILDAYIALLRRHHKLVVSLMPENGYV